MESTQDQSTPARYKWYLVLINQTRTVMFEHHDLGAVEQFMSQHPRPEEFCVVQTLKDYVIGERRERPRSEYLVVELPELTQQALDSGALLPECSVIMRTQHAHDAIQWCRNLRTQGRKVDVFQGLLSEEKNLPYIARPKGVTPNQRRRRSRQNLP